MELVHRPVFAPSRCIACGGGSGEPALDTGVDLPPPTGHVYLCESCGKEIAHRLGYLDPERATKLRESVNELEMQLGDALTALDLERENKTISLKDARKLIAGASK